MIIEEPAEHAALRDAVRSLLARDVPAERIGADADRPGRYGPGLWARLAGELGLAGLAVPEPLGGAGASLGETAILAEELGRCLASTPFLGTAALAENLLLAAGDESTNARLLPGMCAGTSTAAVAYRGRDGWPGVLPLQAIERNGAWTLSGRASFVIDGTSADVLVAVAQAAAGPSLFEVSGPVTRTTMRTLDETRDQAEITFDGAAALLIGTAGAAAPWLDQMIDTTAILIAAEQVGGADRALELAVDYAGLRVQFGRPIGSFQAIKHRCADIAVGNDRARSALAHGIWAAVESPERLPAAAAMAALVCSEAYLVASQESVQIHGGIGFTWDHPCHRYVRRARADAVALAGPRWFEQRLLAAIDAVG
jgi:alkylation response protein AidB-like acyl-CoA dehydrogenase